MLTDDEIGTLVVKIQADDVRPRDLRSFLNAVIHDVDLRRNLKLAGKISGLEEEMRRKNCLANALFLVAHSTLAPDAPPKGVPRMKTTEVFREKFQVCRVTTWKQHVATVVVSTKKVGPRPPAKPELLISNELHVLVRALEEFWDVRGYLLAT